ncbi:DUF2651 domain-containing protein [Bacillus sp. S2(2019)]|uniref:DUF2651 family protein n=2 Tax=Bacillaceae TaxID=186817 RepID=UPI000E2E9BB4|nr:MULTISPECIES: DUF2651 family protein [Bacillus]MBY0187986.1 DUF2651 family protein [Bacillus aerophilus]TKD56053.1 DUF2651 domain-containing protein [Bacillus sp. S2(2019)]QII23337.1 DUF2651 family protein [Bacillus altitudinis]QTV12872.1 DUF2651 family protein [Bacillus altitudinis]RFB43655.1 DUF2651 domain-containing protein [Bacillus sp. HMG]
MRLLFLHPMYLILFTLPVMAFLWGFVGYLLYKRIWPVLILTSVISMIFIFAYTGFDLSNLYWVLLMTALAFVSSGLSKVIHVHFQEKKREKPL